MKKKKTNIFLVLCFLLGLSLVLYPIISNFYNSLHLSQIVSDYVEKVNELDDNEYDDIINTIKEYNKYLFELTENNVLTFDKKSEVLEKLEILKGNIGYIEIPKLKTLAPIYYGTSEEVLQISIGLLEGSSFPTGEESTHTVLLGHRGLPSSKLFTDIDKLAIGDVFYVCVLAQKTAYEVDNIEIVEPEEFDSLRIVEGETYTTLVTCTPYGINTHRLLVRGHKVDIVEDNIENVENPQKDKSNSFLKIVIISVIILLILAVSLLLYKNLKKKKVKVLNNRRVSKYANNNKTSRTRNAITNSSKNINGKRRTVRSKSLYVNNKKSVSKVKKKSGRNGRPVKFFNIILKR